MDFSKLIEKTLRQGGPELLSDPKRFLSYVLDLCEDDSIDEMRILANNCTEQLLDPFRQAADTGSVDELESAAARATSYLVNDCVIDASRASVMAEGIARGVGLWRGVDYMPKPSPSQALDSLSDATVAMPATSPMASANSANMAQSPVPIAPQPRPLRQSMAVPYPSTVQGQLVQQPSNRGGRWSGTALGVAIGALAALLLVGVIVLTRVGSSTSASSEPPQLDASITQPEPSVPDPMPEPDPEPSTPEPAPAEHRTLMASDYDGILLRSDASINSSQVASFDPSVVMDYNGESKTGPGESGTVTWFKVSARGKEGWVCSDYVVELPGTRTELVSVDGEAINMRMLPQYGSTVVGQAKAGATIYWYGQVRRGTCSDGQVRDWYIISSGGDWGWARADLMRAR